MQLYYSERELTIHRAVYEKFKDGTAKDISDELPFEIPTTWRWVRLTDITEFLHRGKSPVYVPKSGCPMFAQKCNQWDGIHLEKCKFCSETKYRSYPVEYHLHDCDVVINSTGTGTLGRVGLFVTRELEQHGFKSIVPDSHVTIVRTPDETLNRFIFLYLRTDLIWKWMNEIADGSTKQKELYTSTLALLLIPIPPTHEQVRIMRKIEKLMPLVEEYGKVEETRLQLDADLPSALEKSILQEAIQGKLVPQDPNDEPACELLKRIAAERKALVKAGKLKRDKCESVIFRDSDRLAYETRNGETVCIQDEIPFEIPESWEWVRLGDLVDTESGLSYRKEDLTIKDNSMVRVLRGGNILDGEFVFKDDDVFIARKMLSGCPTIHRFDFVLPAVTSHVHLGKTALFRDDLNDTCAGGFLLMLHLLFKDIHLAEYLLLYFQSRAYKDYCKTIANKSGQAFFNLSRKKLLQTPIPIPPIAEQSRIVERMRIIKEQIISLTT